MNTDATIGIRGQARLILRDPEGHVKHDQTVPNLITTAGLTALIDLADDGTAKPTHMAIGTGSTAAAAGDTTLGTEIDRNAVTDVSTSGAVLTATGDWAAGDGTGAITEAGILSASSSGTLFCRAVFSAINKGADDTLAIEWTWTLAAA